MGFGVVVAGATSAGVPRALASAPRPSLTIVLPPPAPVAAESPADSDPPAAAPAQTPEPAVEAPAPSPADVPAAPPAPEPDEPVISDPADSGPTVPDVGHVFVISLGPGTFDQWFGDQSTVPYLSELAANGTLLSNYAATAHGELANEISMISGQAANPQTDANCPAYAPVEPGTLNEDGQAQGEGCVYSLETYTLPDQLVANGNTWRAYIEGQDAPGADPAVCRHPELGRPDPYAAPRDGDRYVTWRNPFVYFQTVTTSPDCPANDLGLTGLGADLSKLSTTPSLAWVAPSVDNHGPATADAWLRMIMPQILTSKAYERGALVAIVPDASGVPGDRQTGALLLGKHVAKGSIATASFNHLSLLKGIEDLFALRYLGGAQDKKVKSFVSLLLH